MSDTPERAARLAEEKMKLKVELAAAGPAVRRFVLVPFDQIELSRECRYVVKGLIPREGLTVVWGSPKCGKSFWCFDLALHVALGREYRGRRVVQGAVVYVALEGGAGFGARAEAFRQAKMAEDALPTPFHLIIDRLDLVAEVEALIARIREQMGDDTPILIVLDTLNRSLRGSESSDEDMTAYIQAADALREAFHCAVVIVHHCGIDATRPRGHTSLAGAVDAQLAVKRDLRSGLFTVTVEWQKDGPEGDAVGNRLEVVEVGTDTDGDPITSCVVVEAEPTTRTTTHLTARQKRSMAVLHNVLVDHGKPAPEDRHFPPGANVIAVDLWKEHLLSAGVLDKDGANPRQDFRRLKEQLAGRGVIGEWNGLVWAVRESADAP